MDDYAHFVYALTPIWLCYLWWMKWVREDDLLKFMKRAITELREDPYATSTEAYDGWTRTVRLQNHIARIVYTETRFNEEVFIKHYFPDAEKSGANVLLATRCTVSRDASRKISWWRKNHLSEMLLYNVDGFTSGKRVSALTDDIISFVRKREHAHT